MRYFAQIAVALLALASVGRADPIPTNYVGPSGTFDEEPTNYTIPENWSPPGVPNNVMGSAFNVTILPAAVFVDIPVVISTLTIKAAPGSLTVKDTETAPGSFDVDGDTTVDGALVAFNSNVAMHGALLNFDPATGTLTGGNLTVEGFDLSASVARAANLQFTDANVVHNAGAITVVNHASITDQLDRDGLRNFGDNLAGATFVVGAGYSFVAASNFTNAGTVEVQPALDNVNGLAIDAGSFQVAAGHQYIQTAGSTVIDGALTADLTDLQGGELSLGGTVTGTVLVENATVSPTNQFIPTISGDLDLSADSTLLFSIPSLSSRSGEDFLNNNFDRLVVNGTVTLGGSTLALDVADGFPISSHATFSILESDNPLVGNFGNVASGDRLTTLNGAGSFVVTGTGQEVVLSNYETIPPAAQFANLSTRGEVLTGDNILIGGFIVGGAASKDVLVRALGPSLADDGIAMPLADPTLELHDSTGALILANDNWKDTQQQQIEGTGIPPEDDLESAILATLTPGAYTVVVRGNNGGTGTALVEIYDLAPDGESTLSNLSTRGFVDAANPLIGGFIAGGSGTGDSQIVARALGPDLAAQGITNPLPDPLLELRDVNGALVLSNDDYVAGSDSIIAVDGLEPGDPLDAALRATLAPGPYTALVFAKESDSGIALVELYDLFH